MTTINDIAKYAGVSNRTISAVLNNRNGTVRVSQTTKERVLEAAKKLNYTPNTLAQGLRTGQSFLVGVIIAQITNSFIPEVLQGIENVLTVNNYSMILSTYHNDQELKAKIGIMEQKKVDGIVVFPGTNRQMLEECDSLINSRPTVFIGRDADQYNLPCVYTDGVKVGKIATEYLLSLGHRCIAFLAGACPERERGYKAALAEAGLLFEPDLFIPNCVDFDCGKRAFETIRTKPTRPTAVISYSDNVAAGFIAAAAENGVKVPDEISVIGIDDLPIAQMLTPALTTISQPKSEQGSKATEMLMQMIKGDNLSKKDSVIFDPMLIKRKSCRNLI